MPGKLLEDLMTCHPCRTLEQLKDLSHLGLKLRRRAEGNRRRIPALDYDDTVNRPYPAISGTVRDAWAVWLESLGPWDWWVTLTFRDPKPDLTGPDWNRPGWATAKAGWTDFKDSLRPNIDFAGNWDWPGNLKYAMFFELQKWRGAPHIHALVGGLSSRRYRTPAYLWWWLRGACKIEVYKPNNTGSGGAQYYLTKYVTKELAHWEIEPGPLYSYRKLW